MLTKIDELNRPEYEAISYDDYFAPMDIPEEDKEKRVEMAEEIDDIYYNFFAMIATMVATQQYLDWDYLNDYLNTRLYDTFENYEYSSTRDYLRRYADLTASNTVTTTLDHQGEEYYLSDERASRLAAENAQTIANYTELQDAILAGFTHKTWKSELIKTTRKDHREMNGHTILIEKYYMFKDCEMLMPHDEINGTARQCANCLCSLRYSTQENEVENEQKHDIIISDDTAKPLEIDDFEMMASTKNILPEVYNVITSTIKEYEKKGGMFYSDFEFGDFYDNKGSRSLFQTTVNSYGQTILRVNNYLLGGKSLQEADDMMAVAGSVMPDNLKEAVVHECGHAKACYKKSAEDVRKMNMLLENRPMGGLSPSARKDGAEVIPDVEVLLYRGETVPKSAMDTYNKYTSGKLVLSEEDKKLLEELEKVKK